MIGSKTINHSEKEAEESITQSLVATNSTVLPPKTSPNKILEARLSELRSICQKYKAQVAKEGEEFKYKKIICAGTEEDISPFPVKHDAKELNFFLALGDLASGELTIANHIFLKKNLYEAASTEPQLRINSFSDSIPRLYIQTRRVSHGRPNETIQIKIYDLEHNKIIFQDFYSPPDNKDAYRALKNTHNFIEKFDFNGDLDAINKKENDNIREKFKDQKNSLNYLINGTRDTNGQVFLEQNLVPKNFYLSRFYSLDEVQDIKLSVLTNNQALLLNFQPRAIKIEYETTEISNSFSNFLAGNSIKKNGLFIGSDRFNNNFIVSTEPSTNNGISILTIGMTIIPNYEKLEKNKDGNYIFNFDLEASSFSNKLLIKPFEVEEEKLGITIRSDIANLNSPLYQPFVEEFIKGAKEAYRFTGITEFPIKNIYINKSDSYNGYFLTLKNDTLFLNLDNASAILPEPAKRYFGSIAGRHEAFHAIQNSISITQNDNFENAYSHVFSDFSSANDIFSKINESNFYSQIAQNLGHSESNSNETFASLLNSLYQQDNWEDKLDMMNFVEINHYKNLLEALKNTLQLIPKNSPEQYPSNAEKEIIKRTNYILEKDKK